MDQGNEKKRRVGSGRQPLFSEFENYIWEWIVGRITIVLVVRRADIQKFAIEFSIQGEMKKLKQYKTS